MGALDIVILLLLLMFAVVGFKQGIIKELVQLVGMIAILVISFLFKDKLGELMCLWLPFFNFIGTPITGLTSLNILIYQLLGFVTIFAVLYGVYSIILKVSGLFQKVVDWTIILLIPSKIGGFLIGAVEGYIIMFILLVMVMGFPAEISQHFRKSELVNTIVYKTPFLSEADGTLPLCSGLGSLPQRHVCTQESRDMSSMDTPSLF